MKFFIVTLAFLSSVPAFAISDQNLVSTCAPTGKTKLAKQAEAYGCQIDVAQMSVDAIDNRLLNPSKYVWYKVDQRCGEFAELIVLVQYYRGRCF